MSSPSPGSPRILVVEDDPDFRALVRDALEDAGYRVECALDAPDALDRLRDDRHGFDAVVTDERMPGLTGTELVAGLRGAPQAWYTPVVLVSGFADAHLARAATALGVSVVLSKPVPLGALVSAVQRVAPIW